MSAPLSITSNAVVLLVQPERDDREMYSEFLRHAGLIPIVASHGTPALSFAPDADLIVTGLLLPGHLDGIGFIGRLKSDPRTRDIPLIVLTSSAWDTERERALSAGCDLFLAKPCLPDELLTEIRRLLGRSAIRTKRRQPAEAKLPNQRDMRRKRKGTG